MQTTLHYLTLTQTTLRMIFRIDFSVQLIY